MTLHEYYEQCGNRITQESERLFVDEFLYPILGEKDAKYGFGRLIDLAHAEPVAVVKHDREGRMIDQAIHNKIVSFIRGIEANLGSRSHLTPDSRTLSADAKRSEPPRWR